RGFHFLENSMGDELSEGHLEAAIASLHCAAPAYEETDWCEILGLYDSLYRIKPSPVIGLNRAVALGKAEGPEAGLAELARIPDPRKLKGYPFYSAAHGEFHLLAGRPSVAAGYFEQALKLARTEAEKTFFERKLKTCSEGDTGLLD